MLGEEQMARSLANAGVTCIFGVVGIPVVGFAMACQKAGTYTTDQRGIAHENSFILSLLMLRRAGIHVVRYLKLHVTILVLT